MAPAVRPPVCAPELAARLLELAARTRGKIAPRIEIARTTTETFDIVGSIESIPSLPPYLVSRAILTQLREQLVVLLHNGDLAGDLCGEENGGE